MDDFIICWVSVPVQNQIIPHGKDSSDSFNLTGSFHAFHKGNQPVNFPAMLCKGILVLFAEFCMVTTLFIFLGITRNLFEPPIFDQNIQIVVETEIVRAMLVPIILCGKIQPKMAVEQVQ